MKKVLCTILSLLMIFSLSACKNDGNITLCSGNYYAVGDYEEGLTPYFSFNIKDNTFYVTGGSVVSLRLSGNFKIIDNKLIAELEGERFAFEIKNSKTIVLIGNTNWANINLPKNTKFVYSTKLK